MTTFRDWWKKYGNEYASPTPRRTLAKAIWDFCMDNNIEREPIKRSIYYPRESRPKRDMCGNVPGGNFFKDREDDDMMGNCPGGNFF